MATVGRRSPTAKIWALLTPSQRRGVMTLLLLMFVGTGFELMGVGLVLPALAFLTQADYATRFPVLQPFLLGLGNPSRESIAIGGMVALVLIYLIKAMCFTLLAWYQSRVAFGIRAEWSRRLFSVYLGQPYTFHLQHNSAKLVHNVTVQLDQFANSILIPGMTLLVELLVFIGLSAMIVAVEPVGAFIIMSVLAMVGWSFHQVTRTRIIRWGEVAQLHDGLRFQHLIQGLGGAKEVKLLGREAEFLNLYDAHNQQVARVVGMQSTLQQLPRLWLELIAIGGLAFLTLIMVARGHELASIIPVLGMFAAAAFRLLPSISRIINTTQMLKYGLPIIENLHTEFNLPTLSPALSKVEGFVFQDSVEFRQVDFTYPGANGKALKNISLSIKRGESVGFIGTSGSGKSTLVDTLLGLLTPDSGKIFVDGQDIQIRLRDWQDQLGYVPQTIFLTDDTLRRNVAFGLPQEKIDTEAVNRALRAAQLEEFVSNLPEGLDTNVGERGVRLSGGQRQRIGIARALYHDPAVLVLDEATSALDTITEAGVMESVQALHGSKTIVIVAHRHTTVQYCDRVYTLETGQILNQDGPLTPLESQKLGTT